MIFTRLSASFLLAAYIIFVPFASSASDNSKVSESESTDEETILEGAEALRVGIKVATAALTKGEFQKSRSLLEAVTKDPAFSTLQEEEKLEALFVLGQAFNSLGLYREATKVFRGILIHYPDLARVRLELARSLFLLHEDAVADFHFRMALAGDLPENVVANVHRYLREIRNRRRWSLDFRATAVGNSNVNLAPTIRQIEMGPGIWILDRDARAKSGFGIATELFGEYRHPLEDNMLLRLGAFADHTHYSDSDFNDTIIGGYVGPYFILPERRTLSLLANGYRRWYGGEKLNTSIGPAIEYTFEPSDRIRVSTRLEHSFIRYDTAKDYDGSLSSITVRPLFILSPTSFLSTHVGIAYDRTKAPDLRNMQYRIGAGYQKDLPFGFTWGLHPEYRFVRYSEEWASFGTRRKEHILTLRTNILNRSIDWFGFTPVLGYLYQDRNSSIELYDFDQHRIDFSFTKQF